MPTDDSVGLLTLLEGLEIIVRDERQVVDGRNVVIGLVDHRVRYSRACRLVGRGPRMSWQAAAAAMRELRYGCELEDLADWVWVDPSLRPLTTIWPGPVLRVSSLSAPSVEWAQYLRPPEREDKRLATVRLAGTRLRTESSVESITVEVGAGEVNTDRSTWKWKPLRWRNRGPTKKLQGTTVAAHTYEGYFTTELPEFDTLARFRQGDAEWVYVGVGVDRPPRIPKDRFVEPHLIRKGRRTATGAALSDRAEVATTRTILTRAE